jgi:RHS repeat-associated protein
LLLIRRPQRACRQAEIPLIALCRFAGPALDAVYKPFGETHSITGSATLNLRFPGQYFLIESGVHYNWHRHYDPTLGRYTQPDPLEFADGPSRYAYARSSPAMYVDPSGQIAWVPIIVGIGAGVLLDYVASRTKSAICKCDSTSVGPVASGTLGGAAGLFGPFGRKPFGALGSGVTTSPFSQLVGAGYSSGYYGLWVRNALRGVGSVASYLGPLGFTALAVYHIYDITSCTSQ